MSGSPGSDPDAKYPSWVVNAWDGVYMDVLDYQWSVAVPFWKEIDALARDNGVRVAIELHPQNLVFNVPTIERLVEATGATNVGVEMDTSHLMWQQMDVPAVIRRLGSLIYFAAAKDVALFDGVKTKGVLDNEFTPRAGGRPEQGADRVRPLVQRLARGPGLALRRRRRRPPGRLLGRGAAAPCARSTRTSRSTSSTKTPRCRCSTGCRWQPRRSTRRLRRSDSGRAGWAASGCRLGPASGRRPIICHDI